jgi:4-amino-4-deoxy-L-arabinose transferase-like glycosyltransferase
MVAMLGILVPLLRIVLGMKTFPPTTTTTDYWLLKFPFQIHVSWILCATFLNVNVLLVANGASASGQTVCGATSLVLLFLFGINALAHKNPHKVWVVPCVVAWASFAIAQELSDPRDQIKERFPEATISHTKVASSVVGYLLVLVVTLVLLRDRFFPTDGDDDDDDNVLDSDADSEERDTGRYSSLN